MTSLKNFSRTLLSGSFLKSLLVAGALLSFTACNDGLDNLYPNQCAMTADQKQEQKALDIEVIKKHFEDNNLNLSEYQVTPSGLHYKVLEQGTGDLVKVGDRIDVHYVGKLLNGNTFDSSYEKAQVFKMTVGTTPVIEGWTEALQLMKVGEETRFYIPSYIAYGRCGSGNGISPNAVLMFDIKVIRKY